MRISHREDLVHGIERHAKRCKNGRALIMKSWTASLWAKDSPYSDTHAKKPCNGIKPELKLGPHVSGMSGRGGLQTWYGVWLYTRKWEPRGWGWRRAEGDEEASVEDCGARGKGSPQGPMDPCCIHCYHLLTLATGGLSWDGKCAQCASLHAETCGMSCTKKYISSTVATYEGPRRDCGPKLLGGLAAVYDWVGSHKLTSHGLGHEELNRYDALHSDIVSPCTSSFIEWCHRDIKAAKVWPNSSSDISMTTITRRSRIKIGSTVIRHLHSRPFSTYTTLNHVLPLSEEKPRQDREQSIVFHVAH